MQMSLLPPNMSDSLAGNWFLKSKSIGILTLQTSNSFFWNTELWRRTTTSSWLFFLFLYVAWVSAWMTSVFFLFPLFLSLSGSVSAFISYFAYYPDSLFWFKVSALFSSVNLPSFSFSLLPLPPSSAEGFSSSNHCF